MKILIWSLCAVLVAFWTAVIALSAQIVRWIADGFSSGQIQDFASGAANLPAPKDLPAWIDPQWVQVIQPSIVSLLSTFAEWSPLLSSAVSWLVPLVWLVWAMGLIMLLSLSGVAHWAIGKFGRGPVSAA